MSGVIRQPKKKVVKVVKKVVKKVKRTRGFLDEPTPDGIIGDQQQQSRGNLSDDSSSDDAEAELRGRRALVNRDVLSRFVERQTGLCEEAEVLPGREKPVISNEMKEALRARKVTKDAAERAKQGTDVRDAADASPVTPASFIAAPVSPTPSPPPGFSGIDIQPVTPVPVPDISAEPMEEAQASPTPPPAAPSPLPALDGGMWSFEDKPTKETARMPMWCTREYLHSNRYVRLHDELVDLVKYLRPTREEQAMRELVVTEIEEFTQELFPGSQLIAFGSMVTGLILPTSDVDMTICYDVAAQSMQETYQCMDRLAHFIVKKGLCEDSFPQVIKGAKVPIVKFTHKDTWIDVDISFNSPNGRVNSEMVVRYTTQMPIIRPLVTVVKYFLQQRSMHEPFTGGLGSYAISLMVIAFIQHHPAWQPYGDSSLCSAGGLLMDFFRFYGAMLDYETTGIDVATCRFFRKTPRDRNERFFLIDPQNPQNNVAGSARQLESIKSAMRHAFLALASDSFPYVPEEEKSAEHPYICKRPTLLSRVIHIDHAMLDRRAKVVQAYERWVEKNPTRGAHDVSEEYRQSQVDGARITKCVQDLIREHAPQLLDARDSNGKLMYQQTAEGEEIYEL
eukprot:TRINITY_DN24573_c0_g1_i1.p1 TRINITY_DN24573_c0_g1~~TRINITY_DN24573_c0_g1_i1.p1  ORF type:complete len:621 (+),score=224.45 TRINITY_DN24573_c0_g1_i1:91-1953(+)